MELSPENSIYKEIRLTIFEYIIYYGYAPVNIIASIVILSL